MTATTDPVASGVLRVGTSGWAYPEWRRGFYTGVPPGRWLAHYAERFNAVEVNATFYRRMRPETLAHWRNETPPSFAFAVKGQRFITHIRRLKDVTDAVSEEKSVLSTLGDKLAAVLWQLPSSFKKDLARLAAFADDLARWPEARHAIEFRHASWFDDETLELLVGHSLATCVSDAPRWPLWSTVASNMAYVRLHGHERVYRSAYGGDEIRLWAERARAWLAQGLDVHVYFDNTAEGAAPLDAERLIATVRAGGGFGDE